jgi:hypothetical protein
MKKALSLMIVIGLLSFIAAFAFSSTVFAWSQSTHAYVAKKCLGIENNYLLNYNARLGCIVPDFFWYLRDVGFIPIEPCDNCDETPAADLLHGPTEQGCVIDAPGEPLPGETTFFYEIACDQVMWWQFLLKSFTEGIGTHVYADIIAHDTEDGYLEGPGMWVDTLLKKMGLAEEDRDAYGEAAHLALEFSVDALLVHQHGLQLADLLFSHRQAGILEKAFQDAFDELNLTLEFDVSTEFRKYLALMRALEKAAAFYAPYLISKGLDGGSASDFDAEPLIEAQRELSEESLDLYTQVFMILLQFPKEIYTTITDEESVMHWEENALVDVIEFCKNPTVCNGDNGGN